MRVERIAELYKAWGMDVLDTTVWERDKVKVFEERRQAQEAVLPELKKRFKGTNLGLAIEIVDRLREPVNGVFLQQLILAGKKDQGRWPKSLKKVAREEVTELEIEIEKILKDEQFAALFKLAPAYVGILRGLGDLAIERDPKEMKAKLIVMQKLSLALYRANLPVILITADDGLVNPERKDQAPLKWLELAVDVLVPDRENPTLQIWKANNRRFRNKWHPGEKGGRINEIVGLLVVGTGWSIISAATGQSLEGDIGFVLCLNLMKTKQGIIDACRNFGWRVPKNLDKYLVLLYLCHEHDHRFDYKARHICAELATDLPAILELLYMVERDGELNLADAVKVIWGEYAQAAKIADKGKTNEDCYGYSGRAVINTLVRAGVVRREGDRVVIDGKKIEGWKEELENLHWLVKYKQRFEWEGGKKLDKQARNLLDYGL